MVCIPGFSSKGNLPPRDNWQCLGALGGVTTRGCVPVCWGRCNSAAGWGASSLIVLETRRQKSRCPPGWFLPRTVRGNLSHACLLATGVCGQSLAFLGLQAHPPDSAFTITWHSPCELVCVQISPLYKYTSHTGLEPHLTRALSDLQ